MSLTHKKVGKRSGDGMLFNDNGRLTEEALQTCKICGVDPRELMPKSVESFLKQGMRQADALRQHELFEKQRQIQVKHVMKNMIVNTSRTNPRKMNTSLNHLSMGHDERILRTTYKSSGGKASDLIIAGGRQMNNTGMQMRGGNYAEHSPGSHSALDSNELLMKQERNRHRWLSVLRTKEANIEQRYGNMKKQLAKGFKREKEVKNVLQNEKYKMMDLMERNAERHEKVSFRKRDSDIKAMKKRREEEASYKKRMASHEVRRQDMLHRKPGDIPVFVEAPKPAVAEGDELGFSSTVPVAAPAKQEPLQHNSSQQLMYQTAPKRIQSSISRKLQQMQTDEEVQRRMQSLNERQSKADLNRFQQQSKYLENIGKLTSKVDEKLQIRSELEEGEFMKVFEKSVNKRVDREKKRKMIARQRADELEMNLMDKETKDMNRKQRLAQVADQKKKKIAQQLKRWEKERRNTENNPAVSALAEKQLIMMETNMDRQLNHKVNITRCKRKQQEYKAVLVDNLIRKENRGLMISEKRNAAINYGMQQAKTMQDQIITTAQNTASAVQPVPFEVHKKEFLVSKANKPEKTENDD